MTIITKGLLIAVAVLSLSVGALGWQLRSAHRATAEAAVAPAKEQAAVSKAEERKAAVTLDARLDTVTRWLTHTVHDTVPSTALHPVTPADTATAVAALPIVEQRYQGCRVQLQATRDDCASYKLRAEKRAAGDSTVIAKQDAVIAGGLVPRRWSLGVTAGYGGVFAKDTTGTLRLYTGPSVVVGVSLRVW